MDFGVELIVVVQKRPLFEGVVCFDKSARSGCVCWHILGKLFDIAITALIPTEGVFESQWQLLIGNSLRLAEVLVFEMVG